MCIGIDVCIGMHVDVCVDVCTDVCTDMCVGMCVDVCVDMCMDICTRLPQVHMGRCSSTCSTGQLSRHTYAYLQSQMHWDTFMHTCKYVRTVHAPGVRTQ